MDEDKLKAILGGSVDDGAGALSKLARAELTKLHKMEEQGKNRTTMLAAIDGALRALPEEDGGDDGATGSGPAGDASNGNAPVTYTQDQVDQMLADQRGTQAAMFTREQVDQALADRDAFHAAEKDRAVAEATGATARTVAVDEWPALTIAEGAANPALSALTGLSQVVFVDSEGRSLIGLPAMTFTAADFEPSGTLVTLKAEIEFPKEVQTTEVAGAFLLDDSNRPIGCATLVMPFAIGGGRTTRLAKSTLAFGA